jgi:hypothetical protein
MANLYENSLKVAELLLGGAQPGSAARRRAVSTAYYALFQRLSSLCAICLSRAGANSEEYRRAYRALDHRQARDALSRSETLFKRNLADTFAELQDVRHWADYSVSTHPDEAVAQAGKRFALNDARDYVIKARQAVEFVDSLDPPSRQRLAVLLVVRDRR